MADLLDQTAQPTLEEIGQVIQNPIFAQFCSEIKGTYKLSLIHILKEEGQEGFTAHLRHDISFGEEGALIRQAGAYRALYFCPGADRFAIEKNGAVVPYSQFGAKDGSWGLAVFEVTLGELPARVRLVWSPAEESRRKKAILNLMRIGPVVAPGER